MTPEEREIENQKVRANMEKSLADLVESSYDDDIDLRNWYITLVDYAAKFKIKYQIEEN